MHPIINSSILTTLTPQINSGITSASNDIYYTPIQILIYNPVTKEYITKL